MNTDSKMTSSKIHMDVESAIGLHLRPIAKLVQIASQYKSDIVIEFNDARANGKSILEILMLGISPNTEFTVLAYGDDSDNAVQAINEFFRSFKDEEMP